MRAQLTNRYRKQASNNNTTVTTASSSTATSKSNRTTSASDVESDLGTLIINSESDDDAQDRTLKPAFMQHFDRAEQLDLNPVKSSSDSSSPDSSPPQQEQSKTLEEDSTLRTFDTADVMNDSPKHQNVQHSVQSSVQSLSAPFDSPATTQPQNYQPLSRAIMLEGDFEFLRYLTVDELKVRMKNLDMDMENEIEELRRRYAAKRQPILDAIDTKRTRQQNY